MNSTNRRSFTRALAAGSMDLSSSRGLGANDRIRVGVIGCGGMGTGDWRNFLTQPDVIPGRSP
jgi:hypothetical protein